SATWLDHLHACLVFCTCLPRFLVFFLSLLLPSLVSTLFPYTTLFRSPASAGFIKDKVELSVQSGKLFGHPLFQIKFGEKNHLFQDRKSTRLNSSHVSISYAVFCLKKKKNTK